MTDTERKTLTITVAGGGPVGLMFALTIKSMMPQEVALKMFDCRWMRSRAGVVWKGENEGNARRQQIVTIQSRQYSRFPVLVRNALFSDTGAYTEMWPQGPDSPSELGSPRNVPIAYIEDKLLEIAERESRIELHTEKFNPIDADLSRERVLVISDGAGSATREHYIKKFGSADTSAYSMDGVTPLQDTVLGLKVRSLLPDPTSLILTISQNRFLLNSLNGDGFLNMRLAPEEVREVIGVDIGGDEVHQCIQSNPCGMLRKNGGEFLCPTHNTGFKPAIDARKGASVLWPRIEDGLKLFNIPESQLTGVTAFRVSMVQRPRFTTELLPPTPATSGTFGCLIGDAANAIHFWPGRGLNSGFAAAYSLAKNIATRWTSKGVLRDSDFMRHEAAMAMLQ